MAARTSALRQIRRRAQAIGQYGTRTSYSTIAWETTFHDIIPSPPDNIRLNPPNQAALKEHIQRTLFSEGITVRPESKQIGNEKGLRLMDRLDRLEKNVDGLKQEVSKVDDLRNEVKKMNQKVDGLENNVKKNDQKMNQKVDGLASNVRKNDQKMNQKVDGLASNVKKIEDNLHKMDQKVDGLASNVRKIEDNLQKMDQEEDGLASRVKKNEDHLHKMDQKMDDFKKELGSLQINFRAHQSSWWEIRAHELQVAFRRTNPHASLVRNELVHGGNVKDDLKALDFLLSKEAIGEHKDASTGFKITYGFSVDQLKSKIATAPEEIVGFLDRRGSLWKIYIWNDYPKEKEVWISTCDRIVSTWMNDTSSHAEGKLKEEYDNLCQQMVDKQKGA